MGTIINFMEAKQFTTHSQFLQRDAMESAVGQRSYYGVCSRPSHEKTLYISALPWETIPDIYEDLRPYLQRDGLILHSWSQWNCHKIYGDCYSVTWIKSSGKTRRYCTGILYDVSDITDFQDIMPRRIAYSSLTLNNNGEIADTVFYAAPENLHSKTISPFVQRLKYCGITVDFDYDFRLDKISEFELKRQGKKWT